MFRIEYTPDALKDMREIKAYITDEFDDVTARRIITKIAKDIRRLEMFPLSGRTLSEVIEVYADYYYLYSSHNYVFYRLEGNDVKIIRILNADKHSPTSRA